MFRKLLFSPLRLLIGWGAYPQLLGTIGVLTLILLRVTIGWHFYSEGVNKQTTQGWDAGPFFNAARGPFASQYHRLVPDRDGFARLDIDKTMKHLAIYRDRAGQHFGFDQSQQGEAQQAYVDAIKQVTWVLEDNAAEIEEYRKGKARIERLYEDEERAGVASLDGQRLTIEQEWRQLAAPVLVKIDNVWTVYEKAVNDIATDQQATRGYYRLYKPTPPDVPEDQLYLINEYIPYFDMAIGICLMFGILTPPVALIAAGFLFSVFLSQYPPAPGPGSTSYQVIESMACLVLAGTGAGRFAGVDFVLHALVRRAWPSQESHNG